MITGQLYVPDDQWSQDTDDYFIFGKGYWAKVAPATAEVVFICDTPGTFDLVMRVRTGGGSGPTEYLSAYKWELDGVSIPFILDTSKPNEKRDEFGGSNIGYIKGSVTIKDTNKHSFKFTSSKLYGAFDFINDIWNIQGISQTKYDADVSAAYNKGLADGKIGMVPQSQVDSIKAGYDTIIASEVAKAREAEAAVWKAKIQLLPPVATSLQGIQEVIKQVIG